MTEEENKAIELIGCLNLNESYIITSKQWNEQDVHKAIDIILNLIEKLKKENQELRNTKNNCPQFNTSGIKCKNKDIHCPTSKETLDYYENFLIPGYEEEIKKLQKENEELKEKNDNNNVYKDLQEDLTSLLKKEFIPKDKIRDFIKRLEKDVENIREKKKDSHDYDRSSSRIQAYLTKTNEIIKRLEKLLEEEQKYVDRK